MQIDSQSSEHTHRWNDRLSHGKKPRVWTAQRICTSSKASRSGWSLFALFFSSRCILLIKSRYEQYNQTPMRASLLARPFTVAGDWFSTDRSFFSRIWVVLLTSYRISDWKEVSLFERTSDWSFSILSRKAFFIFLLLSWYTQSCVLLP